MPPQRRYYVRLFASESLLSLDFLRRDSNRISLDLGCGWDFRFNFCLRFRHGCQWWIENTNGLFVVFLVDGLDLDLLSLGYHLVVEGPASTASKLSHNHVAVS
jgi:hypothetical protein